MGNCYLDGSEYISTVIRESLDIGFILLFYTNPDCRKLRNRSIFWRFPSKPSKKPEALGALEPSPSFRQASPSKINVGRTIKIVVFLCY